MVHGYKRSISIPQKSVDAEIGKLVVARHYAMVIDCARIGKCRPRNINIGECSILVDKAMWPCVTNVISPNYRPGIVDGICLSVLAGWKIKFGKYTIPIEEPVGRPGKGAHWTSIWSRAKAPDDVAPAIDSIGSGGGSRLRIINRGICPVAVCETVVGIKGVLQAVGPQKPPTTTPLALMPEA